jgi:peptidoglycan/LPS O-acetylase OafA/YrhL
MNSQRVTHRILSLDGLRAFAVLAVVAGHVSGTLGAGGWIGVDVFFVLSGYLITSLLLAERERTAKISLRGFYVRRLRRLSPALVTMVAVGAVWAPILGDRHTVRGYGTTAALALTYTEDLAMLVSPSTHGELSHTWSLAVEEHFYVLWPLIVVWVTRRGGSVTRWALSGGAASYVTLAMWHGPLILGETQAYFMPFTRSGDILIGCGLGGWLASHRLPSRIAVGAAWAGSATLTLLFVTVGGVGTGRYLTIRIFLVAAASAAVVAGLAGTDRSFPARALSWGPLRHIGAISYGIYLYHPLVLAVVHHYFGRTNLVDAGVGIPLSLLAAEVSYRYIERRFLRHRTPNSRLSPRVGGGTSNSAPTCSLPNQPPSSTVLVGHLALREK